MSKVQTVTKAIKHTIKLELHEPTDTDDAENGMSNKVPPVGVITERITNRTRKKFLETAESPFKQLQILNC
jgi:hypothetical protein